MNAEQRIRMHIGDLTVQVAVMTEAIEMKDARITELEAKLKELAPSEPAP